MSKLQKILDWKVSKPSTDAEWSEDVKKESFDVKYKKQLDAMKANLVAKLPRVQEDLNKFDNYPDAVRYELRQQLKEEFSGKKLKDAIEEELESQHDYYRWKTEKIKQSVERLDKELDLRARKKVSRKPVGTTYFIDSDNGNNGSAGTAIGTAWADLHKFTENARSAGDIAILRRGMTARYDDGGDLAFTSSGDVDDPIIIEADYGDAFSDHVDLSGTATGTLTFGSKTITFSSDVSGVVATGDWLYETNDDAKDFAYEVKSVSTVTVTLYLPYKGDNAGSGKTVINMQSTPIWNTISASFQWNFDGDHYWLVQGIQINGIDGNGNVEIDSSEGHDFIDCAFTNDGTNNTRGFRCTDDTWTGRLLKCRWLAQKFAILGTASGAGIMRGEIRDCLGDGTGSASGSSFLDAGSGETWTVIDTESSGYARDIDATTTAQAMNVRSRNWIMGSTLMWSANVDNAINHQELLFEDFNGTPSDTRQHGWQAPSDSTHQIASETSTVRSGGSTISIKITPPASKLAYVQGWSYSRLKLFELPFYATTDSKTYTVYFRPTATGDWTADPTANELFIELESWGHASNNFRQITKSTGTIDMNGSTDWQTLTVTVAPAQAGVAYLRCYYSKAKEAAANTFFVDPIPEIT